MELLLFDIDGTLLTGLGDYESSLGEAIEKAFNTKVHVDISSSHGLTDRKILSLTLFKNNIKLMEKHLDYCLDSFWEIYSASKKHTKLLPEVRESIICLQKNNLLGLVTGNVEKMARKKLGLYNLNCYFKFGAFGEESLDRNKLVRIAIKRARDHGWHGTNKETYVIGDTPLDINAAIKTKTVPVGVTTGRYSYLDLKKAGADYILQNLSKLDLIINF